MINHLTALDQFYCNLIQNAH